MSMRKPNHSKALYKFAKKQRLKDSTSTKDIDDSLEQQQAAKPVSKGLLNSKKPHQRTQSCPFIAHPNQIQFAGKAKADKTQRSEKGVTVRSSENKMKNSHRHCHSQGDLQSVSNGKSISIQSLSAIVYRKKGELGLKKVGALNSKRSKPFFIHNDHYSQNQIEQQMKRYQLKQELRALELKSKGSTIKQQILYDLISKFEEDLPL